MVPDLTPGTPRIEPPILPLAIQLELKSGEEIIFAVRQSPLTPLAMLWPVGAGLVGWSVLNSMSLAVSGMLAPVIIQFGIIGLTTILALRWLIRDGLGWYVCWYVLTNQRLVVTRGLLRRTRQEAAIARIQTIRVERTNAAANALGIGDVIVLTASSTGAIHIQGVQGPEDVAYTIGLAQQGKLGRHGANGAPDAPSPLDAPAVRTALAVLLEEEEAADADADDDDRSHLLQGGFLHRSLDLAMLPGERVLDRLYRHWFTLLQRLLPPFLIGMVVVLLLALLRTISSGVALSWILTAFAGLGTFIWEMLIVANYIDDCFILTNQRIIDIDRSYFIFAKYQRETLYRSVQDVSIDQPLLGRFFSYGHLNFETAGRAPNIAMENMAHPRRTQERIFALINADRERRADADRKSQRKELHTSVGAVLTALMLATPDVRSLPVTTAVTRLRAAGLAVVIAGEQPSRRAAPGAVLAQSPSPGATVLRGSEVSLTLSRRPSAARP